MTFIADLHLHSRYAYATSKNLNLRGLAEWAQIKGIDLLATGDFTHPLWLEELARHLEEGDEGLFRLGGTNFVLGTEVSCVYKQHNRARRVHVLVFLPSFVSVTRFNSQAARFGKLEGDGRPILKLSVRDLVELALEVDQRALVIPAHVWTPWYGVFGSKSGFNSLAEAFGDMAGHIHAIETGLSSDPAMNWAVPELANRAIVSFSDAHSLPKLGREVTVFDTPLSYEGLTRGLAQNLILYTAEFYPEEGKYHFDGHRRCSVSQHPAETSRRGSRCPVCRRPLTLGVLNRVLEVGGCGQTGGPEVEKVPVASLAQDDDGFVKSPQGRPPFVRLISLQEILAATLGVSANSRVVDRYYRALVDAQGSEHQALLKSDYSELEKVAGEKIASMIIRARLGNIEVIPGYDGVYGRVKLEIDEA